MKDVSGKTAFITGGASGIGNGMAHAFAKAGMNVVIADIEQAALDRAVTELRSSYNVKIAGVKSDVSLRDAMFEAAKRRLMNLAGCMWCATMQVLGRGEKWSRSPQPTGTGWSASTRWRSSMACRRFCRISRRMARAGISSPPPRWPAFCPWRWWAALMRPPNLRRSP
ncbi:MAG: SDR family NAD(P)-dependent oxidoreductase [Alphaproteobacteria bacterium]|nr:SDR family NAD(P)-dependent oxidoreductase [Alphaproteobacteria bacterium]